MADTEPTVVLVHGAFADASSFRRLYDVLRGEDVTMIAPPVALRGLTGGDGEYLRGVIDEIDGPVLLVGHSLAARSSPPPARPTTWSVSSTSPALLRTRVRT
jgi:pimeloyl-ACP methyl ester carboxylesterase